MRDGSSCCGVVVEDICRTLFSRETKAGECWCCGTLKISSCNNSRSSVISRAFSSKLGDLAHRIASSLSMESSYSGDNNLIQSSVSSISSISELLYSVKYPSNPGSGDAKHNDSDCST